MINHDIDTHTFLCSLSNHITGGKNAPGYPIENVEFSHCSSPIKKGGDIDLDILARDISSILTTLYMHRFLTVEPLSVTVTKDLITKGVNKGVEYLNIRTYFDKSKHFPTDRVASSDKNTSVI